MFGGRAPPGPTGVLKCSTTSRNSGPTSKEMEGRGGRKGNEGLLLRETEGREEMGRKGLQRIASGPPTFQKLPPPMPTVVRNIKYKFQMEFKESPVY